MMLQVAISIEDDSWQDLATNVTSLCESSLTKAWQSLDDQSGSEAWVSILLTNDQQMQSLNSQYRNKDKPTNVLSFPSPENTAMSEGEGHVLGDIALSAQTIVREAAEQSKTVPDHLAHLLVHGLLHLLGYDHEVDDEAAVMEQLEIDILATMDVPNPYGHIL
ncbi:MAG: rRNA maturation RNase YbeY [Alphaproteobacteria bacterium]|nr:MAG: rRNA maturation RNase YbeY [Alphaproteobacteria bacterium]